MGGVGARAEVRAAGVKAGIGERGEGDVVDRRIGIAHREGVDDPALPEIAHLTTNVEGVDEVGVEFGEDLGDEDGFVRVVAVTVIGDRNGGGIPFNLHSPVEDRVERIARDDDRYRSLRMVRHIEQIAVRRQRAAPRLGAHRDRLPHYTQFGQADDRDVGGEAVGDIRHLVVRVDGHAAGLEADCDLVQLFRRHHCHAASFT